MINSQKIGGWLVKDLEELDRQVRLFGDMLRNIDDLSNLLDFYHENISGPTANILTKSSP